MHSATKTAAIGFAASLEMKENADFLLTPALFVQEAMSAGEGTTICFDGVVELKAPLSRTHVVLFARYWVSRDFYRVGVVWAEPHAGSLNFPIYPPTLNIVSDPNSFRISHQLMHAYDGVFAKPLGERGPFKDRFNVYRLSNTRFAESEILDLCRRASEPGRSPDVSGQGGTPRPKRQTMLLPERPITVAFSGQGPMITIEGQKRQYSQLEIMDCVGGRKLTLDYQPIEIHGRTVSLPRQIEVHTGDTKQLLRRERMSNVTACEETPEQVAKSAEQFSHFDPDEIRCRDLLIKYWLKNSSEIAQDDIETLERLRKHFAGQSLTSVRLGEQLKRVNMLLQVDWMLDDPNGLEESFREYAHLLRSNGLGRMVLFGGENLVETTARWGQPDTADRLLPIWLDAAVAENDMAAILDFASGRVTKGSLWTTAKLLEKALGHSRLPAEQRFAAEALRCTALSRIAEMVRNPDKIKNDVDIARTRWVLWVVTEAKLREELKVSVAATRRSFGAMERPTRQDRALKKKLDAMEQNLLGTGVTNNEGARSE